MADSTRVLVVDDEAGLRKFLTKELTARGLAVEGAGTAEEGLRKLAEAAFDVVLLDMRLPGMDGLTALREIRRFDPPPDEKPDEPQKEEAEKAKAEKKADKNEPVEKPRKVTADDLRLEAFLRAQRAQQVSAKNAIEVLEVAG